MDFSLTEAQGMIIRVAKYFAEKEMKPYAARWEENGVNDLE